MIEGNEEQNRSETAQSNQGTGLGLGGFSMTAVHATESQDATEIGRRSMRTFGWIIGLLILVAGLAWWFTQGVNQFWKPEQVDVDFLIQLQDTQAVKNRVVQDLTYKNRLTINCQIAPGLATQIAASDRETKAGASMQVRSALKELVLRFSNRRPNEEVNIIGLHGDEELAHATFKPAAVKATDSDEIDKQIWIHIEGESMDSGLNVTGG